MLRAGEDHHLYEVDEETNETFGPICEEISVQKQVDNLFTHVPSIILVMTLWAKGRAKTVDLDSGLLHGKKCMSVLTRAGLHIQAEDEAVFMRYLVESAYTAPVVYCHDRLGFYETDDSKLVFLTDQVIGDFAEKSSYRDPKVTAPKGTVDSWKALAQQEVEGHLNTELALSIGISAPVTYLLLKAGLVNEVPIWGFTGASSTGKTSMLRLCASVFGSPDERTGLLKDFKASDAAFYAMLRGEGVPFLIDEATRASRKNTMEMLYDLSKGLDKLKCEQNSELKARGGFSGNVIITGEQSLLGQSTANLGLYARVCEPGLVWTDDAEHARRISQGVRQNYGTAIVPYAEHLLKFQEKPERIEQAFNKELQQFKDTLGEVSGEQERLLNMYATVTLAAKLFNKALGLKLNVKGIQALLVDIHKKAPKRGDLAQELYNFVRDKVGNNGSHFPTTSGRGKAFAIPANLWGEQTNTELWISGIKFREFTKEKFGDCTPYLNELYKQGLVKKFSGGFTSKHNLGGNEVRCYCFYKK